MAKGKTYCIYQHISPNNKRYFGVTSMAPKRRWLGGSGYCKNKRFNEDIKLYGWDNFKHEILLEGLTRDQASLAEKIFIYYYNTTNPSMGYNLQCGGVTEYECSEETKRKLSSWERTPEICQKISKSHTGMAQPQWVRDKISNTLKGQTPVCAMRAQRPIEQIDIKTGEVIKVFSSAREAQREVGVANQNIARCCKNPNRTANGYKWRYAKEIDA